MTKITESGTGATFTVTVQRDGKAAPPVGAHFTLLDDDVLHDGDKVRGNLIVDDKVQFRLNVDPNRIKFGLATVFSSWDTRGLNSDAFWVAYVLEGFQGADDDDADPDNLDATGKRIDSDVRTRLGVTQPIFPMNPAILPGGSIIYYEVIRDAARQLGLNGTDVEQDVVVHEIGHALVGGDVGVDVHPVTGADKELGDALDANRPFDHAIFQAGLGKYVPKYLALIRSITKPLS